MGVVRVNKTANYTVLSNYHFKEKEMSLKAKGLLSLMLSLPDTWNYTIAGLVSLSKDGKDSVMSALGELEKFGYLIREQKVNSKGQFSGIEYNIFEQPQEKNPVAEKQNSEKENAGNQISENPPQLNTNFIKNLKNEVLEELNTYTEVLSKVADKELRELYLDYAEMRKELDYPLTPEGMRYLIKRCERYSKGQIELQKILLEAAIINQWRNVYPPTDTERNLAHEHKLDELRKIYGIWFSVKQIKHLFKLYAFVINFMSKSSSFCKNRSQEILARILTKIF